MPTGFETKEQKRDEIADQLTEWLNRANFSYVDGACVDLEMSTIKRLMAKMPAEAMVVAAAAAPVLEVG